MEEHMGSNIFTFGYTGQDRTSLVRFLNEHDGVLCDIRFSAFSKNEEWNKPELLKALGRRYLHLQTLGNMNYKVGGPIELKDSRTGVQVVGQLATQYRSLVLMCACPSYRSCHRRVVAELLRGRGIQVSELSLKAETGLFAGLGW
jgi:hypothetical protein